MITLKLLKLKLLHFFDEHAQINQTVFGDDFDFNAETNLNYPVAVIEYITDNIDDRQVDRTYQITLVDRIDDNVEGIEDEIYSDMEEVAIDFVTWLRYQPEFFYNKRLSLQKIVNDGKDRFAGFTFQISLSAIMPLNECSIPKAYIDLS